MAKYLLEAGISSGVIWAVGHGGGLYRGGTLQHWYFSAIGIFSSQGFFNIPFSQSFFALTKDWIIFLQALKASLPEGESFDLYNYRFIVLKVSIELKDIARYRKV